MHMPGSILATERERVEATLEAGSHLDAEDFLCRYEAMPEIKKAELINGIVYMGSPVRADQHGEPDNLAQGCLFFYSTATPGVKASNNTTVRLGPKNIPQPDGLLRSLPECGGAARLNARGFLEGPPELVVEIAASSASMDAHEKLAAYRECGIPEYLLWRTEDEQINWWALENGEYRLLPRWADGTLRSRIFPGLWLDVDALLKGDAAKAVAKLQEGLQSPEHAAFVAEITRRLRKG